MVKIRCPVCGGKGWVRIDFGDPEYEGKATEPWGPAQKKPCPACEGTGLQEVDDSVLKYVPGTNYYHFDYTKNAYPPLKKKPYKRWYW